MIIKTRNLGLAAFIKMNNEELLKSDGRWFSFESKLTETEWYIKYLNSCCYNHDRILCDLRTIISSNK